MAKINIVIADSDELYLNHLTNYLIERMNTFEVYSFTTKESLIKFVGDKSKKIDIIAFTEDLLDGTISVADIPAKILLTDGSFTNLKDFDIVNKYQKADKFINDLLMVYAEKTGRVEAVTTGDKATQVIGFYSPVGGSGKTTLALATAYAEAMSEKRVFYFNAERINSTGNLLGAASSGSMSDVYLSVKTKGANVGLRIIANKYTDPETNITYINSAESSLECNELSVDEFKRLINEFEKLGEFDVVIVDFDSDFSREKIEMLEGFDKIFVPFTTDEPAFSKMRLFLKELEMHEELKEIFSKIFPVLNKANSQSKAVLENSDILKYCEVKATVSLSPVFADINNVLHAGNTVLQSVRQIVENI